MQESMVILIILIVVLSLVLLVLGGALLLRYQVGSWPHANGKILSSVIEKKDDEKSQFYIFTPKIKYKYLVGSKSYYSERIKMFLFDSFSERFEAQVYTDKFKEGEDVKVYYHPFAKSFSVLLPDDDNKMAHIVATALIALLDIMCITYFFTY